MSTCAMVDFFQHLFAKIPCLFPEFGGTQSGFDPIFTSDKNLKWLSLHGSMTQKDRTNTFFEFCNLPHGILFATDVAARGLDIPSVDFIIQYHPPHSLQNYIVVKKSYTSTQETNIACAKRSFDFECEK